MTISLPVTIADRETSGGMAEPETVNQESSRSDSATGLRQMLVKKGARKTPGGGTLWRQQKTARFIAKMKLLRTNPANCKRCGQPRDCDHRRCRRCVEKAAKRRLLETYKTLTADPDLLTMLVRRIESLEMRLARAELWREYNSNKIQYIKKREAALKAKIYPRPASITRQELATMNHAYARRDQ